VLLHKLREAMAEDLKGRIVGGEGKVAEVDGGYFGGYVKPANLRENRRDRRLAKNHSGKPRVVVIVRERGGNSVPAVFRSEGAAYGFLRQHIAKGTVINADEANSWDELHRRFEVKRINHVQPRWRLHERGGRTFQPYAPGRNRAPSSYRRPVSAALRARG